MKPNLSQSDSKRMSVAGLETPHHKCHMLSSAQFDIRCGTIHLPVREHLPPPCHRPPTSTYIQ